MTAFLTTLYNVKNGLVGSWFVVHGKDEWLKGFVFGLEGELRHFRMTFSGIEINSQLQNRLLTHISNTSQTIRIF